MLGAQMGLGANIEKARIAAGYTNAAEFARLIGVSPGTLGDWEGGRYTRMRLDNLLRIAKGAQCRVEDLVVGVDEDYDRLRSKRRDPIGQELDQYSGLLRRSDVAAQARLLSVATELLEASEAFRRTVQDATRRLSGNVANPETQHETRATRKQAADRVRVGRKVG